MTEVDENLTDTTNCHLSPITTLGSHPVHPSVLSYPELSYPELFYPELFYPELFYPELFYPELFYPVIRSGPI